MAVGDIDIAGMFLAGMQAREMNRRRQLEERALEDRNALRMALANNDMETVRRLDPKLYLDFQGAESELQRMDAARIKAQRDAEMAEIDRQSKQVDIANKLRDQNIARQNYTSLGMLDLLNSGSVTPDNIPKLREDFQNRVRTGEFDLDVVDGFLQSVTQGKSQDEIKSNLMGIALRTAKIDPGTAGNEFALKERVDPKAIARDPVLAKKFDAFLMEKIKNSGVNVNLPDQAGSATKDKLHQRAFALQNKIMTLTKAGELAEATKDGKLDFSKVLSPTDNLMRKGLRTLESIAGADLTSDLFNEADKEQIRKAQKLRAIIQPFALGEAYDLFGSTQSAEDLKQKAQNILNADMASTEFNILYPELLGRLMDEGKLIADTLETGVNLDFFRKGSEGVVRSIVEKKQQGEDQRPAPAPRTRLTPAQKSQLMKLRNQGKISKAEYDDAVKEGL